MKNNNESQFVHVSKSDNSLNIGKSNLINGDFHVITNKGIYSSCYLIGSSEEKCVTFTAPLIQKVLLFFGAYQTNQYGKQWKYYNMRTNGNTNNKRHQQNN